MNAPVSAALLQARAANLSAPHREQPLIADGEKLLKIGYEHEGLYLDLHGTLDADGYDVRGVTLTGDMRDLTPLFSRQQLVDMSAWCDSHLPSAHEYGLISMDEARIERLEWARRAGWNPP